VNVGAFGNCSNHSKCGSKAVSSNSINAGDLSDFSNQTGRQSKQGSFPALKQPGRGVDHPLPFSAEVKERVQLQMSCSSRLYLIFCDQIRSEEIGRACGTHGGRRGTHIGFRWGNPKRDHSDDIDTDLRIILKWI